MRIRSLVSRLVLVALALTGVRAEIDASSWVLVRLREPLVPRVLGGGFALPTGRPRVDVAVAELGIHRIDHALQVSARNARHSSALRRSGLDRLYRFHVPPGTEIREVARRLTALPEVEYAEPDLVYRAQAALVPDDTLFTSQWGFDQASGIDVDGPEAWSITTGASLKLAVIDTGIDLDHPDLADKIDPGWDFVEDDPLPDDDFDHGTRVASIAAAATNNSIGMAGSCWNCRIVPLRILDGDGNGLVSWFADAVIWAVDHGADVINFSGGGPHHAQTSLDAIRYAREAGVIFLAATGNGGGAVAYPANYRETIAVGASTQLDLLWSDSNVGPQVDNVAPGAGILGATRYGGYQSGSGTSFSTPLVSGLAALIETLHPHVGSDEVRDLINFGSEDQVGTPEVDTPGRDPSHGWGRVNMNASLLGAQAVATLHVDGTQATRPYFEIANPVATSYDFVRGRLEELSPGPRSVEIGDVLCLENDSPDPDTAGDEDTETPAPGEGFFYLGRFNSGSWPGSFGGSSDGLDRIVRAETSGADRMIDGDVMEGRLGGSLAAAGDVDGDGYDDLIAGAWTAATPANGTGSAFVYTGSATGLSPVPAWVLHASQAGSRLGYDVATAGDVNGDGYDDLIVGQPWWDGATTTNEGRAHVYLGSPFGISTVPHRLLAPGANKGWFGASVSSAGDVNGDGYDDVIVGATRLSNGESKEGKAFLYMGSATGLSPSPAWEFESNQVDAHLGSAVSSAGDVNDDGYDDMIVSATVYDGGQLDEGRVWLFLGSPIGPGPSPATILEIDAEGARFGGTVAPAGDLNGDGRDDVIVSAPRYSNGEQEEGAVFVYHGSSTGVETTPAWSFETDQYHARIAYAAAAGDVDHDGNRELLVGSTGYHWTLPGEGGVWIFAGAASGPQATPAWAEIGRRSYSGFGVRAVGVGDLNGDGHDDVAVSADEFENLVFAAGRLYIYHGSASGLAGPAPIFACDERLP